MADDPATPNLYNRFISAVKPKMLDHKKRAFAATVAAYTAVGAALAGLSDAGAIEASVLKAAAEYNAAATGIKAATGDAAMYEQGLILQSLRQAGLNKETMARLVETGDAGRLMDAVNNQLGEAATGQIRSYLWHKEGPKAHQDELTFARGYIGATGDSRKDTEVAKSLEGLVWRATDQSMQYNPKV